MSFADFQLADLFFTMRTQAPELFDAHPQLSALTDRVYALPRLKKYLESRPHRIV